MILFEREIVNKCINGITYILRTASIMTSIHKSAVHVLQFLENLNPCPA